MRRAGLATGTPARCHVKTRRLAPTSLQDSHDVDDARRITSVSAVVSVNGSSAMFAQTAVPFVRRSPSALASKAHGKLHLIRPHALRLDVLPKAYRWSH